MSDIAISQLRGKLDEVMRDLMEADKAAADYRTQALALETSLKLFGYEGELPSFPAHTKYQVFKAGEISRQVFDVIREHPEMTQPRDIAAEIVRRNGWDTQLWGRVMLTVREVLKRKRRRERENGG